MKSQVTVFSEILLLSAFPNGSKVFDGLKGKSSLLISELTILSESVEAHNILAMSGQERLFFNLGKLTLLRHIELTVFLLFFSDFLLFLIEIFLSLLRFFELLLIALIVNNGLVECLLKKAGVVLEWNCQKRSKSWDTVEMHLGLSNYFGHIYMIVVGQKFINWGFLLGLNLLSIFTFCWFSSFRYGLCSLLNGSIESLMRETLVWFKNFRNHVIVIARRGMNKSDFFRSFIVCMCTIIILIFDLFSWSLKFPNIYTSGSSEFTDNFS